MSLKLYLLSFFVALLFFKTGFSQTFVPDNNFEQALIDLGLDTAPLDDFVPTTNIVGVTSLTIDNRGIQDLTGIEDFSALTQLFVQNNLLTTIDISTNTNLQILWCFNNALPNLNVSNNQNLISLRCDGNGVSTLDLSNNPELNVLTCENNTIQNLDVSINTKLNRLVCGNNLLTNLNLSNNPEISQLDCSNNQISNLDMSNNTSITLLNCANNSINELDTSLQNQLIELDCSNNQLCYLNVNNGNNQNVTSMNFDGNTDLTCVIVDNVLDDRPSWVPLNYQHYVVSINACNEKVPVDILDTYIGTSFTLPPLNNGAYYTGTFGSGSVLNEGDVITQTQTIYIYNENNCFNNQSNFSIVISNKPYLIPKYFTPNNDGINDVWKVVDPNNNVNSISIFNRHGQLLKFLPSKALSWNGTFNGKLLPSDSYWYEIVLNNREVVRGYFALKR
ncbi:T9SS type B sorting domain-containing protein [Hyunsoonleella ulvae]|uniref:T9SS type B sorting domain-containing protein n=1 Tax=Hyunsoonleella ulvae TaxID=2799948 RepID=UPI00193A74C1|nr:T9SS type B sorting domain-containing protein [Hyunsoonleella ulvae]